MKVGNVGIRTTRNQDGVVYLFVDLDKLVNIVHPICLNSVGLYYFPGGLARSFLAFNPH